jgi:AraC-like DNA-binding protein
MAAPSFTAGSTRALLVALGRLGHDVPALLRAAGLSSAALEDPDALVPCATIGAVFGIAQGRRPIPDLCLRLAQETPLGAFPLLDYLIVTSETVGEGLRRFARHAFLAGGPIEIEIRETERPIRVLFEIAGGDAEYTVALSALHLSREADGPLRLAYVSLRRMPDDPAAYERALGCPVRGGASWSGLALPAPAWRLPLKRRDPALHGVLERHAADVLASLPAGGDFVADVRRVLAKRVSGGDTRLSAVAQHLGTSARTLQRRLGAAAVSYHELLDQSRCEAAERHLADSSLSIAEVSWLVGYSEPSAFHRAFKRWRGVSPQSFRQERRAATA